MEDYPYDLRPKPGPLPGIWADFWAANSEIVGKFVSKYKPAAISPEAVVTPMDVASMKIMAGEKGEKTAMQFRIPNIRGGMKIPHLHFKGDIYLLNEDQWKTFTSQVIEKFQTKLGKVGTVSFEKLMHLSEAVDSLA